jgi:hypothetical protein
MIGTWEIDSCNLRVSIAICSEQWVIPAIDKILIKSRMKSNTAARKSVLEWVKLQWWVGNVVKWRKHSPVKFANFVYICITRGKNNHFLLKNGYLSVFNANIYKICEFHRSIFSSFYNNSQPNFEILLIWRCSFQLLDKKISSIAGIIHLPINIVRLIATLQYSGKQNNWLTVRQCKSVSVRFFFVFFLNAQNCHLQ